MQSRKKELSLPNGTVVELPLLVPSFSSKGFGFFSEGKGADRAVYTEATNALEQMGPHLDEAFLFSAYDLHHGHFRDPYRFIDGTTAVFLDSGGYELSPDFDSTEPRRTDASRLPFTESDYRALLDDLATRHADAPFIVASFDWHATGRPFKDQIDDAKRLFRCYPHWAKSLLLKPSRRSKTLNIEQLAQHLPACRHMSVVGVTEKELGSSLFERLRNIAKLRRAMSESKVTAPLHIWGGLDPLVTPLYYFAGADIFDGVSWLRYAFHRGVAVNRDCYPILKGSIRMVAPDAVALAINENQMALARLQAALRAFAESGGLFELFDDQASTFESAHRTMLEHIPELRGR